MASDIETPIRGDWHPAGSSRATKARLVEKDGKIVATAEDGGADCASAAFSALEFSPRVGSIPRRIQFPDASLFETSDNDAVDRLLRENGRKRAGFVHGLERFRPRLALFVAATFVLAGLIYRYALPLMVEIGVAVTPPVVPKALSLSTLETLDRTVLDESRLDAGKRQAIIDGFATIAEKSGRGSAGYSLNFRKGGAFGPNAFALPDGTLIVTDELVDLARGDDEMIVGVLAHEIGHVELEHSLRQIYRVAGLAALIMLIAGDVGETIEDILLQGSGLLALSYSRAAEADADRHSVELMLAAGRDPAAIARFFERMEKELGATSGTTILSTHPGAPERKEAILDYAAQLRAASN